MTNRKRNDYLDLNESDNDDDVEEHVSEEESKHNLLPSHKRRKTGRDSSAGDDEDAYDNQTEGDIDGETSEKNYSRRKAWRDSDTNAELLHLETLAAGLPSELKLQARDLDKNILSLGQKKDKSGVVYLSRVPPFMKPLVLRSLLTPYGPVGRLFLTPETSTSRTQRLRSGGTRRKLYLDGWVEFKHKRDAKSVAENLNAQIIGGKKRSRWHDEVWNIKYLSGVKWTHLVEQIQNENAERAARLRFEISQGKKENKAFLENIEKGKMLSGIEATRIKRGEKMEDRDEAIHDEGRIDQESTEKPGRKRDKREFSQHTVTSKSHKKPEHGQDVQRVLNSIL